MSDVTLSSHFLANARGFTFKDGGGATWSFSPTLNQLSVALSVSAGSVADDAITNAKLANMAQATIKGRAAAAGTGDPVDLTASQVKTILALVAADVSDFNEAAEDAVLGASANSTSINITYNDAGNSWSAAINLGFSPTWTGTHTFTQWPSIDMVDAALFWKDGSANTTGQIGHDHSVPEFYVYVPPGTSRLALYTNGTLRATFGASGGFNIATTVGFNGTAAIAKPTVSGSRGGNAALASLLTALANYGLITDGTTA